MSETTIASERLMDQLVLDIKSLMILNPSEDQVKTLVENRIVSSHDDQISRFVSMLQTKKTLGTRSYIISAMGEMILASFFVVLGLAILAPAIAGLNTPNELVTYFSQILSTWITEPFANNPIVPIIEFVLGLLLILGGFYNLRLAAQNLNTMKSLK
jgi:hypothetical protein